MLPRPGTEKRIGYIYDLPYHARKSLCDLLDADGTWTELGGQYMGISETQLILISHAILRNGSPTNDLLVRWEQTNGQVRTLFKYLHSMGHKRAMLILAPYVESKVRQLYLGNDENDENEEDLIQLDPKFHHLIDTRETRASFKRQFSTNGHQTNTTHVNVNLEDNHKANPNIGTCCGGQNVPEGGPRLTNSGSYEHNLKGELTTRRYHQPGKVADGHNQQSISERYNDPVNNNNKCPSHLHHHQPSAPVPSCSMEQKILNQNSWNDLGLGACAASPVNLVEEPSRQINVPAVKDNHQRKKKSFDETFDQELLEELEIPYKELAVATEDFSKDRIIGRGGFGIVYKGTWKGTDVAIKKLKSVDSMHQAKIELRALNRYRIDNILPLYGISVDGPEACLLYQYMPNGSLEDRLLCKGNSSPLTWDQRGCIGEGLAKALNFLHTLRGKPLVHGDVKSANVLLDSQNQCKLGDFGLARQIMSSKSKGNYTHLTVTSVHGTCVYLPPEYLRNKMLSPAVDVFSYGVVMLEMATGKRAYDGQRLLLELVHQELAAGQLDENRRDCVRLKDPRIGLTVGEDHWFNNLIRLGLDCANKMMKKRPTMGQVLEYYDQSKTRERIRRLSAGSVNGGSSIISELKTPLELRLYYEMTRETNQQQSDNCNNVTNHLLPLQQPTIGSSSTHNNNHFIDNLMITDTSTTSSSVRQTASSVGYNDLAHLDVNSAQFHTTGNEVIPLLTELGLGDEETTHEESLTG